MLVAFAAAQVDQGRLGASGDGVGGVVEPPAQAVRHRAGRCRGEQPDAQAGPVGAQAQVGLGGVVPGVPPAEAAQHLGADVAAGPADAQGQAERGVAGQRGPAVVRPLQGDQRRERGRRAAAVGHRGLDADERAGVDDRVGGAGSQGGGGPTELVRLHDVADVEDREQVAPGEEQADVARQGAGRGPAARHADEGHGLRDADVADRGPRRRVALLDQQEDLELVRGVVQRPQPGDGRGQGGRAGGGAPGAAGDRDQDGVHG